MTSFLESVMKARHTLWKESRCIGSWLHRFQIIEEYPEGVLELCEICKKTKFFKILNGGVDNNKYMDWHIRAALIPNHPLFYHEFEFDPYEDGIISPYA